MIKAGQVYIIYLDWDVWSIITITNIDNEDVHVIGNEGFVETYSIDTFQKQDKKLLAEYPTWCEAIMSPEFRKGKKNITIEEFKKNIAPYMKKGYVFMEDNGTWEYSRVKPAIIESYVPDMFVKVTCWNRGFRLDDWFDIEPVDNWQESLIEVGI